jgi:hypothetical protein
VPSRSVPPKTISHVYQSPSPPELSSTFDEIDALASSSQTIVDMLCERISPKTTTSAEKARKPGSTVCVRSSGVVLTGADNAFQVRMGAVLVLGAVPQAARGAGGRAGLAESHAAGEGCICDCS